MNKIFSHFRIALLIVSIFCSGSLISCKKSATDLVDQNAEGIPPASPDAVIDPEPNIGGPEIEKSATPVPADGKYPVMTFNEKEHDFGSIDKGVKVTHEFEFKNTGEADLLISDAKGSCGCTVPEYPKDPIKPGKSGKITVSFNSTGKDGLQHKSVTITTNTASGKEKLDIKAAVKPEAKK